MGAKKIGEKKWKGKRKGKNGPEKNGGEKMAMKINGGEQKWAGKKSRKK